MTSSSGCISAGGGSLAVVPAKAETQYSGYSVEIEKDNALPKRSSQLKAIIWRQSERKEESACGHRCLSQTILLIGPMDSLSPAWLRALSPPDLFGGCQV